jgi:hypothetical protein
VPSPPGMDVYCLARPPRSAVSIMVTASGHAESPAGLGASAGSRGPTGGPSQALPGTTSRGESAGPHGAWP